MLVKPGIKLFYLCFFVISFCLPSLRGESEKVEIDDSTLRDNKSEIFESSMNLTITSSVVPSFQVTPFFQGATNVLQYSNNTKFMVISSAILFVYLLVVIMFFLLYCLIKLERMYP